MHNDKAYCVTKASSKTTLALANLASLTLAYPAPMATIHQSCRRADRRTDLTYTVAIPHFALCAPRGYLHYFAFVMGSRGIDKGAWADPEVGKASVSL